MLQQDEPKGYVIATGKQHSVREFITGAASDLGIVLRFEGSGVDKVDVVERVEGELAPYVHPEQTIIRTDQRYFRPAEVETLLGDPSKTRVQLGWEPKITVREMCKEMVEEDFKVAHRCVLLKANGLSLPIAVDG